MKKRVKIEKNIISSALKIFSQKGFYKTTLSDITKSINMSVGNIYNYFPSKYSLAKSSIKFVTNKLASDLQYINGQKVSSKEKVLWFVKSYIDMLNKHPEMIEYFFKVYLAHREIFCDEEHCGFELARKFIDEIEILVEDGVKSGEFIEHDFYISFSIIAGVLGGITFLNGEKVLQDDLEIYTKDLAIAICKALA